MPAPSPVSGLPDPLYQAEFYADVPVKRLLAWVIDVVLVTLMVGVLVPFTAFTAVFFLPFFYLALSFLYRWLTLAGRGATLGMQLMAIELRDRHGAPPDSPTAALHTIGYLVSMPMLLVQAISVILMLSSARGQGLTDHALGTAMINRPSRT